MIEGLVIAGLMLGGAWAVGGPKAAGLVAVFIAGLLAYERARREVKK